MEEHRIAGPDGAMTGLEIEAALRQSIVAMRPKKRGGSIWSMEAPPRTKCSGASK
jgi:hypothetical protein